jgi:hypothetical protein
MGAGGDPAKPMDLLEIHPFTPLLSVGFSFTGTEVVKSEFRSEARTV